MSINIENEKISKNSIGSKLMDSKSDSLIDGSSKNNVSKKEESEKISDASFSFSNASDVDHLYENISNKSKDDINFVYESTLQTAQVDLDKEIDLQFNNMAKKEPGFDEDIKLISSNFFKNLVDNLTGGKQNQQNLEKTNLGYTKYGSINNKIKK